MQCTAVYQKHGDWYLGWVEEVPGVNTQGKTLKETQENLKEALEMVVGAYRSSVKKELSRGRVLRRTVTV